MGYFLQTDMKKLLIMALIIIACTILHAQDKTVISEVKYTTELQYNLKDSYNWVNLLELNVQLSSEALGLWHNGFVDTHLISTYRTSKERIANDWQVFSNIEEENRPLRILTLGYTQTVRKANLFFGIRNVNLDYFTTPYTSLFTNSSCGIYPTISANYPLANYPLSAMCLHAEYEVDKSWTVKNSLYNGTAYESLKQVFTIAPQRDGAFNITQLSYVQSSKHVGIYNLGSTLRSRMTMYDENGESQLVEKNASQKKAKVNYSLWSNLEQRVYAGKGREIGVLAQLSFAPPTLNLCSQYYGVGLLFNGWTTSSRKDQLGVIVNRAKFDKGNETSLELTWKLEVIHNLDVQPAFHLIKNDENIMAIGMFRFSYSLNF